jgi:hypothetical protein
VKCEDDKIGFVRRCSWLMRNNSLAETEEIHRDPESVHPPNLSIFKSATSGAALPSHHSAGQEEEEEEEEEEEGGGRSMRTAIRIYELLCTESVLIIEVIIIG